MTDKCVLFLNLNEIVLPSNYGYVKLVPEPLTGKHIAEALPTNVVTGPGTKFIYPDSPDTVVAGVLEWQGSVFGINSTLPHILYEDYIVSKYRETINTISLKSSFMFNSSKLYLASPLEHTRISEDYARGGHFYTGVAVSPMCLATEVLSYSGCGKTTDPFKIAITEKVTISGGSVGINLRDNIFLEDSTEVVSVKEYSVTRDTLVITEKVNTVLGGMPLSLEDSLLVQEKYRLVLNNYTTTGWVYLTDFRRNGVASQLAITPYTVVENNYGYDDVYRLIGAFVNTDHTDPYYSASFSTGSQEDRHKYDDFSTFFDEFMQGAPLPFDNLPSADVVHVAIGRAAIVYQIALNFDRYPPTPIPQPIDGDIFSSGGGICLHISDSLLPPTGLSIVLYFESGATLELPAEEFTLVKYRSQWDRVYTTGSWYKTNNILYHAFTQQEIDTMAGETITATSPRAQIPAFYGGAYTMKIYRAYPV